MPSTTQKKPKKKNQPTKISWRKIKECPSFLFQWLIAGNTQ